MHSHGRRIAYLPLTVRYPDGTTALVTETDLRDYAGWTVRLRQLKYSNTR